MTDILLCDIDESTYACLARQAGVSGISVAALVKQFVDDGLRVAVETGSKNPLTVIFRILRADGAHVTRRSSLQTSHR